MVLSAIMVTVPTGLNAPSQTTTLVVTRYKVSGMEIMLNLSRLRLTLFNVKMLERKQQMYNVNSCLLYTVFYVNGNKGGCPVI